MKQIAPFFILLLIILLGFSTKEIEMKIAHSYRLDSLGACQGISYQNGRIYMYGDSKTGVIGEYKTKGNQLVPIGNMIKLTQADTNVIGHPTGLAWQPGQPVFMGNSVRIKDSQGKNTPNWKAYIYALDWQRLQKTGTLDDNLYNTIEDDAAVQGTRPEYVKYKNKWYVATADYGGKGNKVRLYNPDALKKAKRTSQKGVLYKKFSCGPWVQNIHYVADKGIIVLIQNQKSGKGWRFTFVDLAKSIETGEQQEVKVIDMEREDELEGFTFLGNGNTGIAVTSSKNKDNIHSMDVKW